MTFLSESEKAVNLSYIWWTSKCRLVCTQMTFWVDSWSILCNWRQYGWGDVWGFELYEHYRILLFFFSRCSCHLWPFGPLTMSRLLGNYVKSLYYGECLCRIKGSGYARLHLPSNPLFQCFSFCHFAAKLTRNWLPMGF